MRPSLKLLSTYALVVLGVTAAPAALLAQTYVCTTTTRTTTTRYTDSDGTIYITTVTVSSRVCVPLAAE
jgi:hypothetical protein